MNKSGNLLTGLIIAGLVLGALAGEFVFFDPVTPIGDAHWTRQAGDLILIRPLMLLIIPLVFLSVLVGVTSIGDPSRLGFIGGATLLYYMSTMVIAVTLGVIVVTAFKPGNLPAAERERLVASAESAYSGSPDVAQHIEDAKSKNQTELSGAWMNVARQVIPRNMLEEMVAGRALGVIVSALLLGLALASGGAGAIPAIRLFESLFAAVMRLVQWVIWLTPIGVFFLVAWTVGKVGFAALVGPLARYIGAVLFGLGIHALIALPLLLFALARTNPFRFMWQMRRPLMTAFGTDSSSATLPVTIECAQTEGGCSKRAANFVLPLGATINMDGTALYEAVAVVFLFQLYGIELTMAELLVVVITATLAAIGAAGIPSAGLVTMVIVVTAVNASLAGRGIAALPIDAIGVIIGVDRILDMCRTTVNVWGDATGAKIISRIAPDEPVPIVGA